jgi:hypothetical protein
MSLPNIANEAFFKANNLFSTLGKFDIGLINIFSWNLQDPFNWENSFSFASNYANFGTVSILSGFILAVLATSAFICKDKPVLIFQDNERNKKIVNSCKSLLRYKLAFYMVLNTSF